MSVEPLDKKSLQLACTTLPIDLVTLNLGSSSRPIKIDGELLRRAAARDVYIELQIAGLLLTGRDVMHKSHTMQALHCTQVAPALTPATSQN